MRDTDAIVKFDQPSKEAGRKRFGAELISTDRAFLAFFAALLDCATLHYSRDVLCATFVLFVRDNACAVRGRAESLVNERPTYK